MSRRLARLAISVLLGYLLTGLPGGVNANSTGVQAGTIISYDYLTTLGYLLPNRSSIHHAQDSSFSIAVESINGSSSPKSFDYVETFTKYDNSTTSQVASGLTYFFDPYDNVTYLGALGFYPLIYTDVPSGTVEGLKLVASATTSSGTQRASQSVNASIARSGGVIEVNYTETFAGTSLAFNNLIFNATNGVLTHGETYVNFAYTTRGFIYTMLSIQKTSTPIPLLLWLVPTAFVVVFVAALVDWGKKRMRRGGKKKVWKGR